MQTDFELELEAHVTDANNHRVGKVLYLVASLYTHQLTYLIIELNTFEDKQVVVKPSQIQKVLEDGRIVQLTLTREELEKQPDFIEKQFSYLGPLDTEPAHFKDDPGLPSVATPLDPFLDGPALAPYNEKMNVPEDSLFIRKGNEVEAPDGKLGRVVKVKFAPGSERIENLITENGLFYPEELIVPVALVKSSSKNHIQLKVSKAEVLEG